MNLFLFSGGMLEDTPNMSDSKMLRFSRSRPMSFDDLAPYIISVSYIVSFLPHRLARRAVLLMGLQKVTKYSTALASDGMTLLVPSSGGKEKKSIDSETEIVTRTEARHNLLKTNADWRTGLDCALTVSFSQKS
jgi:hypothetical protein